MRYILSGFYVRLHHILFLFLTLVVIFYSQSGLADNKSGHLKMALEDNKPAELKRIKKELKNTQEKMTLQNEKKATLEAQLLELENQIKQLLKETDVQDSKLKGLKKNLPE